MGLMNESQANRKFLWEPIVPIYDYIIVNPNVDSNVVERSCIHSDYTANGK